MRFFYVFFVLLISYTILICFQSDSYSVLIAGGLCISFCFLILIETRFFYRIKEKILKCFSAGVAQQIL